VIPEKAYEGPHRSAEVLDLSVAKTPQDLESRPRNDVTGGSACSARFVGYQPGFVVERSFSRHFSSTAGYFYFFTGDFLKQTPPGKDVGYFYTTLTFRH